MVIAPYVLKRGKMVKTLLLPKPPQPQLVHHAKHSTCNRASCFIIRRHEIIIGGLQKLVEIVNTCYA
jgi:hypothetical protein